MRRPKIKNSENSGQSSVANQPQHAAVAASQYPSETQDARAGGTLSRNATDQKAAENHLKRVRSAAASQDIHETQSEVAGGPIPDLVERITRAHRTRRYAMKLQQKIDRALESYVRREYTQWRFSMPTDEREKFNKETARLIKTARDGEGDRKLIEIVSSTDKSREPADAIRDEAEKHMKKLACKLPVYQWVKEQRGAGELGLATIVAETGPLDNYPSPAHVWSRLGYAPFEGFAGSTWKRESWRPRALTAKEWTAHPFSGERYALMYEISQFLVVAQWQSAKKSGSDEGKPTGPYGHVYAARRTHTAITHPEWTKKHSLNDAWRITMKAYLKDLWCEWRKHQ